MKKILSQSIKTLAIALLFGAATVYGATPFQGPSFTPTQDNAPAPVNVSPTPQTKQGPLGVTGLRVGSPGAYPAGIGWGYVQDRLGVGPSVSVSGMLSGMIGASGMIMSGGNTVSGGNIFAGINSFIANYSGTTTSGAVSADKYCLPGTNPTGGCITAWPSGGSGGTTITGNLGEMVAIGNSLQAEAKSSAYLGSESLRVAGTTPNWQGWRLESDGPLFVNLQGYANSDPWGGKAINILQNATPPIRNTVFNTNSSVFEFKGISGGLPRNADILAYDYIAGHLAGNANKVICVDATGKFIICSPQPGSGGTTLTGATNQTIRFSATNTPTANSTMTNDGTRVAIGAGMADAWDRLSVNNGGLHINKSGTDLLFLDNTAAGATRAAVITNMPGLQFWSTDAGGHNADLYARDILADRDVKATDLTGRSLTNAVYENVCADQNGKLVLCSTTPVYQQDYFNFQGITTTGPCTACTGTTFVVPTGVTQILVEVIGGGGGGAHIATAGTGGGGGGGGFSRAFVDVTPGQVFTVTVPPISTYNGTTCSDGADGGTASFGSLLVATGGKKGTCSGTNGVGGQGLGVAGSINLTGESGQTTRIADMGAAISPGYYGWTSPSVYGSGGFPGVGNSGQGMYGHVRVKWRLPNYNDPGAISGNAGVATFTTSGSHSWTVPSGVTSIDVQVWGAGGGGSGGDYAGGGDGGGGGGYINATNIAVSSGQSYSFSIGSGGTGGAPAVSPGNTAFSGTDGGNTTFNGTYVANGGKGAVTSGGGGNPGAGGTASTPTGTSNTGSAGGNGQLSTPYNGGAGGYAGSGPSFTYGKGGNGGKGFTPLAGSVGANGAVVITYH